MIQNHLTVCTKFIVTRFEICTFKESFCQVNSFILGNFIAIAYKIITAIYIRNLVCLHHKSAFIIQIFTDNTCIDNHLTVFFKCISTCRNDTVGFSGRNTGSGIHSNAPEAFKPGTIATKIVSTVNIMDTFRSLPVFYNIIITINLVQTIFRMNELIGSTILSKDVPVRWCIGVIFDKTCSSIHIGISAEVVSLTFNFNPRTGIEARTVAISSSCCIGRPSTLSRSSLIESVCNTSNRLFAYIKLIVRACVAVAFVGGLPALLELAIDRIVEITIHFKDTRAGGVNLTTAVICTYKLTVYDFVVVSNLNLGNNSTPIDNRLTSLAISSVLVTSLCSGCFLVKNSKLCIVNVVGRRNCCEFGCNIDRATEGVTVNNTVNNVNIDVYSRLIAHICGSIVGVIYIVITIKCPNSYGNANESIFKSLVGYTISFNSNCKKLGNLVILKGSLKAVCNDSALSFPSVRIVKLNNSYKLINACKICNVDVNIVDRLCLRSLSGVIMSAKLNHSITCNYKRACNLHGIAKLILNLECNGMNACTESNVAPSGEHSTSDRGLYNNTVNGDLTGGKVKSCVISNSCRECNVVTVDSYAVLKRNSNVGGRVSRSCDSGKHSIVNSGAVVESDIVNVECNYISGIRLNISTNEGRRTRVAFICCHRSAKIIVLRNVNGYINPSGFRNICIGSRVQVCLLACSSRCEHEVILFARIRAVSILYIELRLECKPLTR